MALPQCIPAANLLTEWQYAYEYRYNTCFLFAHALSTVHKLKLVLMWRLEGDERRIVHAFCRRRDGQMLDVRGIVDFGTILEEYGENFTHLILTEVSKTEFKQLTKDRKLASPETWEMHRLRDFIRTHDDVYVDGARTLTPVSLVDRDELARAREEYVKQLRANGGKLFLD